MLWLISWRSFWIVRRYYKGLIFDIDFSLNMNIYLKLSLQ